MNGMPQLMITTWLTQSIWTIIFYIILLILIKQYFMIQICEILRIKHKLLTPMDNIQINNKLNNNLFNKFNNLLF